MSLCICLMKLLILEFEGHSIIFAMSEIPKEQPNLDAFSTVKSTGLL